MKNIFKMILGLTIVLFLSGCGKEEIEYTVSFDKSYGVSIGDIIINEGANVSILLPGPDDPVREGYVFEGWYTDIELTSEYNFTDKVYEDIKVYTKWIPIKYMRIFDTNGGSSIDYIRQDYETVITMPDDPVKEGYVFMGWYNEDLTISYKSFGVTTMGFRNITYYALWAEVQFTITFETNGGSLIDPITSEVGDVFIIDNPTKDGFVFGGWFYDEDLTIQAFIATMPEEDTTLYAQWVLEEELEFF